MRPHLLYPDRDFDLSAPLPAEAAALNQDLALHVLFATMAGGDPLLRQAAEHGLFTAGSSDPLVLRYRQAVLRDALAQPALFDELFALAGEALQQEKSAYRSIFSRFPESRLARSTQALKALLPILQRLHEIGTREAAGFTSPALQALCARWRDVFDAGFFRELAAHFEFLRFQDGTLVSAHLDPNSQSTAHVLCQPVARPRHWLLRLLHRPEAAYTFRIGYRDEAGTRALTELRSQGILRGANALAGAVDVLVAFFRSLREELAFYLGATRLHTRLVALGLPLAWPEALPAEPASWRAHGLYDVNLALQSGRAVVGNELAAEGQALILITGANQGGKSTFLRSLGTAQLLFQAGLCVPATAFSASPCAGVFSHFRREEDRNLRSGKLDEELARMRDLLAHLRPRSLLLMNESFAATNEREGSEIAGEIVRALGEQGVRIAFVTHLYAFASALHAEGRGDVLFLRAERAADGQRSFRLEAGAPLATAYGQDLYRRIFEAPPRA